MECCRERQTDLDPSCRMRTFLTLHLLPAIPPRQSWKTVAETMVKSLPLGPVLKVTGS